LRWAAMVSTSIVVLFASFIAILFLRILS
jgi:hypothetical protein